METAIRVFAVLSFIWPLLVVSAALAGGRFLIMGFGGMSNLSWSELQAYLPRVSWILLLLLALAAPLGVLAWPTARRQTRAGRRVQRRLRKPAT